MDVETITPPSLDPVNLLVGKGIQAFATIELFLGICFATMLAPAERNRSISVFHSIKTFEGKLAALEALAPLALASAEMDKWSEIIGRVRSLQKARNKLAHWNASLYPGASTIEEIKRMKPALVPPIWSRAAMRTLWGTDQPLTIKQLKRIESDMHRTARDILEFEQKLASRSDVLPP